MKTARQIREHLKYLRRSAAAALAAAKTALNVEKDLSKSEHFLDEFRRSEAAIMLLEWVLEA